jgi:hypothetical protein
LVRSENVEKGSFAVQFAEKAAIGLDFVRHDAASNCTRRDDLGRLDGISRTSSRLAAILFSIGRGCAEFTLGCHRTWQERDVICRHVNVKKFV